MQNDLFLSPAVACVHPLTQSYLRPFLVLNNNTGYSYGIASSALGFFFFPVPFFFTRVTLMGSGVRAPSSKSYWGKGGKGVDVMLLINLSGSDDCGRIGRGIAPSGISPPVSTTARCWSASFRVRRDRVDVGRDKGGGAI